VTIDMLATALRRAASVVARPLAVLLGLALGSWAAPAVATAPESWSDPDNGSLLENLLILVGIPIAVTLLLALLVYLPSMMRGQSSEPALAFQEKSEWFGGPRKGVEAAQGTPADGQDKGGAGGRW
jgi:hypothetical protein